MSKYYFNRLGPEKFQGMAQSLLDSKFRNSGKLIQFQLTGQDGAREATWEQSANHPDYVRPKNERKNVTKKWIFQVKFHDYQSRGQKPSEMAVIYDLRSEIEKITNKYQYKCHSFVLITNVPLTGLSQIGTRDKIEQIIAKYTDKIPEIQVWDSADLSRMLDNNPQVRTTYSELIFPGDLIRRLYNHAGRQRDRLLKIYHGYLSHVIKNESKARADQAGDDEPLPLANVFIDQLVTLRADQVPEIYGQDASNFMQWRGETQVLDGMYDREGNAVPASLATLWAPAEKTMILGGPGLGKSTITQFLSLFHAARIVAPKVAESLLERVKKPDGWGTENIDSQCVIRFPFRIELRHYCKWRRKMHAENKVVGIGTFIATKLIRDSVESDLESEDVFTLISENPTLLILDGFDEVPNNDDRRDLVNDLELFLNRCDGEDIDLQIIMSSRPQGYLGEFDKFQPLCWEIENLVEADFFQYAGDWLSERVQNKDDRGEAVERIKRGMSSVAVKRLATTLLQATVMLSIVRKKIDIPEERFLLFQKYVEVVFDRERSKNELIANYEIELRQLHEIVGYKIHESADGGKSEFLSEAVFKEIVSEVWRRQRGDECGTISPNEEIQRIYNLAKERLVFLSGKGSNQLDVDFIIQPYREFFAALYMVNHISARAEWVFQALVKRGSFWLQVLKFYVAATNPMERRNWALSCALDRFMDLEVDALGAFDLEKMAVRRAVLFCLPEFARLDFDDFKRIVPGCIHPIDWWSWLNQRWVHDILSTIKGGQAIRILWESFVKSGPTGAGGKAFALQFFPKWINGSHIEKESIIALVSDSLKDDNISVFAVGAILEHDLEVGLDGVNERTVLIAISMTVSRMGNFVRDGRVTAFWRYLEKKLPRELYLRYLCCYPGLGADGLNIETIWKLLGCGTSGPLVFEEIEELASKITVFRSAMPWVSLEYRSAKKQSKNSCDGGPYELYFRSLFTAINNPFNPDFHRTSRELASKLPDAPIYRFSCDGLLGPDPLVWGSVRQWRAFKRFCFSLHEPINTAVRFEEITRFLAEVPLSAVAWWVFWMFSPADWARIKKLEWISKEERDYLDRLPLSELASYPNLASVNEIGIRFFEREVDDSILIPLEALLEIACDLIRNGGLKSFFVDYSWLLGREWGPVALDNLWNFVADDECLAGGCLTFWDVLVSVILRSDPTDGSMFLEFWRRFARIRSSKSSAREIRAWGVRVEQSFVDSLLNEGSSDSTLALAEVVFALGDLEISSSHELNRRCARLIPEGENFGLNFKILFRCICQTQPTLDEFKLYFDGRYFDSFYNGSVISGSWLMGRIGSSIRFFEAKELPGLLDLYFRVLAQRDTFPVEIVSAIFDAVLELKVLTGVSMSVSDWAKGTP